MPLGRQRILALIKRIHLFRAVEDSRLEAAAYLIEEVEIPAGTIIFEEGMDPDYFYIIDNGRVQMTRIAGSRQAAISLGFLQDEDYFGE
jgi:CRP-like cAMP-binding protein